MQLLDLFAADPSAERILLRDCGKRQAVATSADGRWLFAVGNEGQVFRWDLSAASPADARQTVADGPAAARCISTATHWSISSLTT